jgi:acetyl-CoA carboxylase biotin carboxyl carrier protein
LDIRKVKKLIELLEESGIAEIEIKEGEEAVRISRMPTGGFVTHMQAPMMQAPAAIAAPSPPLPPRAPLRPAPAARHANEHVVAAPMVGTFYASASPGAKPVRRDRLRGQGRPGPVHHRSDEDDEPDRERQGRQGHRDHGDQRDPVEFGQPLFVIE